MYLLPNGHNITTRSDYHAKGLLAEALEAADMSTFLTVPTKTNVRIYFDKDKNDYIVNVSQPCLHLKV
jgi:hypothetical protein